MGFQINVGNTELVDYSKPIPAGKYICNVDKASYEPKKMKQDEHQLVFVFQIIAGFSDDGEVDTKNPQVGRKFFKHYIDPNNERSEPYRNNILYSLGYEAVDGVFEFDPHIEGYDDLAQDMVGKLIVVNTYIGKNTYNGKTTNVNRFGIFEPVTEDMDEVFY